MLKRYAALASTLAVVALIALLINSAVAQPASGPPAQRWQFAELVIGQTRIGNKNFYSITFPPMQISVDKEGGHDALQRALSEITGNLGGQGMLPNRIAMTGWEPVTVVRDYGQPAMAGDIDKSVNQTRYYFKRPG